MHAHTRSLATTQQAGRRLVIALAFTVIATTIGYIYPPSGWAQEALVVLPLAQKRVTELPAGPLYWRVETFPSLDAAHAAAGPTGLVAESNGRVWLFTVGNRDGATPGDIRVAEVGPLPTIVASEYLLRINEASGPPGSVTSVHSHPGSEAFYVLAGEQTIRTATDLIRVAADRPEAGPGAGTPLQVSSTGVTDLLALVMFVVDADQAFSSPGEFAAAAAPAQLPRALPRAGEAAPLMLEVWLALVVGGAMLVGVAGSRIVRRLQRAR
jgi:hypothetical protein